MIQITDASRAHYRRKFEEMLRRLGYARPIHSHIAVRAAEREVLQQMEAEGIAIRRRFRTDKSGHANAQGRSSDWCWIKPDGTQPRYLKLIPEQ